MAWSGSRVINLAARWFWFSGGYRGFAIAVGFAAGFRSSLILSWS
ncbi:hypothetical protein ABIF86_000275 [Bradyrhizobium japonicum]